MEKCESNNFFDVFAFKKLNSTQNPIIELDVTQQKVLDRVKNGRSVFFTGSAGTGKTFLLNTILDALQEKYGTRFQEYVAATAMTGIAGTHIEGTTLNSALGIGVPLRFSDFRSMHRQDTKARVRKWKVLIIDEVSMMSAELFEILEFMLREVRRNGEPAGGIQLILCGDYFQLPPICKVNLNKVTEESLKKDQFSNFGYAFQAPAWSSVFPPEDHVLLRQIFRQVDDDFASKLNIIRACKDPVETRRVLSNLVKDCSRPVACAEGIKPTQIYSRNVDVDRINCAELKALPGSSVVFRSNDEVISVGAQKDTVKATSRDYFKDCMASSEIEMKVGAQVMLLKNLDVVGGLVNGSRGVVVRFVSKSSALASAKSLGMNPSKISELNSNCSKSSFDDVPVVRFMSGEEVEILPALFRHSISDSKECRRIQVPLKLAWTMTIHKCQGLTLDAVQVSLSGIFAPGQAYVALSRARSKEGLQIIDWDGKIVEPDPDVVRFYERMSTRGRDNVAIMDDSWGNYCNWRWGEWVSAEAMMRF